MTKENQSVNDKLLRKRDVAEKLSCSLRTIDREVDSGRLTKVKVRGSVRFRESEVQAMINGGQNVE